MAGSAPGRSSPDAQRTPLPSTAEEKPSSWSADVLQQMEWKRLEYLAADYYRLLGFRAETQPLGADGGIDIKLYRGEVPEPVSIVQCKAWTTRVGVKPVRELLGVMKHEGVATGVFVTTNTFTPEAIEFAKSNRVALVNGSQLLGKMLDLPENSQKALLEVATEGDWKTPSCPSCGTKMVARSGKNGPYWGCASRSRCRRTFPMRR